MPHLEIVEVEQLYIPDMDIVYPRGRRPAMHPLDQLIDRQLVTLNVHVDPAVRAVPHPAGDADFIRLVARPSGERIRPARARSR